MDWPLLAEVPAVGVRTLLSVARRRSFQRGEVVFHRGDVADSLHLVVAGNFVDRITTPLGSTVILEVLGPGEVFGELALLLPERRRSATVAALEGGETRAIYRHDFALLQDAYPDVKNTLLSLFAEKLQQMSDRLVEAHYVDADTRLRRRIVEMAERAHGRERQPLLSFTQEELASLAGTSRATAN